MGRRPKLTEFEAARKKRSERFNYTAGNAKGPILEVFDQMQRRVDRDERQKVAEVERVNRKRW